MSELEAKKYTSIRMLREEIRQDMQDYKLSYHKEKYKNSDQDFFVFNNDFDNWFLNYVREKIDQNIQILQELVEQENE